MILCASDFAALTEALRAVRWAIADLPSVADVNWTGPSHDAFARALMSVHTDLVELEGEITSCLQGAVVSG